MFDRMIDCCDGKGWRTISDHSTEKLIVALGNLEQGKGINVTGQDLQAVMDRIRIELAARAAGFV
jgi:hypothetical protein